jgi:8-oxo-dGTP pyrophosphatase MutT (NUDIX family)
LACVVLSQDVLMSHQHIAPVVFLEPLRLRAVESRDPLVSAEEAVAVDRLWSEATAASPALFDGPAVACLEIESRGGELVLSWARASYRLRMLRRVRGAGAWLPSSVFVTVLQPVEEAGLAVGRASASTATAGRWGLPGGLLEPPGEGRPLDLGWLRRHAVRELAEEVGLPVDPEDLRLWAVTRGEHGNVGVHFLAPELSQELVRKHHAELVAAERAQGVEPEMEELAVVRGVDQVAALEQWCDYLPQLVARYAAQGSTGA